MTEPEYLHATRTSYDTVAVSYAELVKGGAPWEDACLDAFTKLAQTGPVLDADCGPGRLIGLLRSRGLDAFGIDLSPGMIEVARRDHPETRFEVGSMTALDLPDAGLGGVVSWCRSSISRATSIAGGRKP